MHQSAEFERRRPKGNHGEHRTFTVGEFVLASYPSRPPSKLSPRWHSPLMVMTVKGNSYTLKNVLSNHECVLDVSRLVAWEDVPGTAEERANAREMLQCVTGMSLLLSLSRITQVTPRRSHLSCSVFIS